MGSQYRYAYFVVFDARHPGTEGGRGAKSRFKMIKTKNTKADRDIAIVRATSPMRTFLLPAYIAYILSVRMVPTALPTGIHPEEINHRYQNIHKWFDMCRLANRTL